DPDPPAQGRRARHPPRPAHRGSHRLPARRPDQYHHRDQEAPVLMFEIRVVDGVVRMKGRLDASQSDQALKVMRGVEGSVSVDCSELDYISSAGIGVI